MEHWIVHNNNVRQKFKGNLPKWKIASQKNIKNHFSFQKTRLSDESSVIGLIHSFVAWKTRWLFEPSHSRCILCKWPVEVKIFWHPEKKVEMSSFVISTFTVFLNFLSISYRTIKSSPTAFSLTCRSWSKKEKSWNNSKRFNVRNSKTRHTLDTPQSPILIALNQLLVLPDFFIPMSCTSFRYIYTFSMT